MLKLEPIEEREINYASVVDLVIRYSRRFLRTLVTARMWIDLLQSNSSETAYTALISNRSRILNDRLSNL